MGWGKLVGSWVRTALGRKIKNAKFAVWIVQVDISSGLEKSGSQFGGRIKGILTLVDEITW